MGSSVEIVVISLTRATERRQRIAAQFDTLPLPWSFFDAHTSLENDDLTYDERNALLHSHRKFSGPQLAVWSSHYTVIKRFLETSESDYLLVFEDDIIFDVDFPIEKTVDLCAEWGIDYLRLYGMYYAPAEQLSFFYDRAIIRYKSSPCGAQAYIVSKAGARKFSDTSRNIEVAVDLALDRFWQTGLPIYAIFPFPVIEKYSPTSIPILPVIHLTFSQKINSYVRRAINKARRVAQNARLSRADASFRRKALPFQQVHVQDLKQK